jgi:hypothetical protein
MPQRWTTFFAAVVLAATAGVGTAQQESVGTGTAFIVNPDGLLLTAHHVIDQAASITVSCNGRAPVPVTVTSSSPTVDLAVLTAESDLGTETFLRLTPTQQPALGDEVFTVGYPTPSILGRDPKYTNGTVSALSGLFGDASFMQISVPVQPGNSGGPLVNQNGEVIGVVVATADAPAFLRATDSIPQNINWAVKSVFASALFTPPAATVGTDVAPADVIAHVTDATCLVEARSNTEDVAERIPDSIPENIYPLDVLIEHRHFVGWHLSTLTLNEDSLGFRELGEIGSDSHNFITPVSNIRRLERATDIWGQGPPYPYTIHFFNDTAAGSRITFRANRIDQLDSWLSEAMQFDPND